MHIFFNLELQEQWLLCMAQNCQQLSVFRATYVSFMPSLGLVFSLDLQEAGSGGMSCIFQAGLVFIYSRCLRLTATWGHAMDPPEG